MPNYILDFGEITIATHPKDVKRLINKCKKEIKNFKKSRKILEQRIRLSIREEMKLFYKRKIDELDLQERIILLDLYDYKEDLKILAI